MHSQRTRDTVEALNELLRGELAAGAAVSVVLIVQPSPGPTACHSGSGCGPLTSACGTAATR